MEEPLQLSTLALNIEGLEKNKCHQLCFTSMGCEHSGCGDQDKIFASVHAML